jgi:hypothetical protein
MEDAPAEGEKEDKQEGDQDDSKVEDVEEVSDCLCPSDMSVDH